MSRLSSRLSGSSSAPAIRNGDINPSEWQDTLPTKRPGNPSRSSSLSNVFDLDNGRRASPDPDRLFTKHTISEVKVIQQRLRYVTTPFSNAVGQSDLYPRTDADAKQEELRVMVG
jgi:hypothetical protein